MTAEISTMPGGGIARRPLHVIIMADCSGSMGFRGGERINALNFAIAEMLRHLIEWQRDQEKAEVLVRVLRFADSPIWHLEKATPVAQVRWEPLRAVEKGRTNFGPALTKVAEVLGPDQLERRAYRPAIVLITDGVPSDKEGQFEAGLAALQAVPAGRSALRLAVAIGREPSSDVLNRFIGDSTVPVLWADNTDEVADRLVAATIALSRMSEAGVDRGALVDQLLRPNAGPGLGAFEGDTVV